MCDFIRNGGDSAAFMKRFGKAASEGFEPSRDLARIGLANQTTMLMSESLEIAEMLKARDRPTARWGAAAVAGHFQAFDTICSATQERQDAVVALLANQPVELMLVIGGYNSSNTANLARIPVPPRGPPSTSPIPSACFRATKSAIGRSDRRRRSSARNGFRPLVPSSSASPRERPRPITS